MKRKAQVKFYALMVGIVIIVLALALATPVKEFVSNAMNKSTESSIGLDCSNSSISNFDKATCTTTDLLTPYFIGVLIFIGGAVLTAKIVFD